MSEFKCPKCGAHLTVRTKTETTFQTVQQAKDFFPDDLEKLLDFQDMQDHIRIKPKEYLGRETFAQIARIVREAGGEYISAGKESHFKIKKITVYTPFFFRYPGLTPFPTVSSSSALSYER